VSASGPHPDSAKEHTAIMSDMTAQTAVKFSCFFSANKWWWWWW